MNSNSDLKIKLSVYAVLALIHVFVNSVVSIDNSIPAIWLLSMYLFLFVVVFLGDVLGNLMMKKLDVNLGQVFLLSSMLKMFVSVLFLVLMIKFSGVNRVIGVLHFVIPYLLGTFILVYFVSKNLNKS